MTDAVLVRAPVGVAYRTLTDLDAWPSWLDGCRSERTQTVGTATSGPGSDAGRAHDAAAPDHHRLVLPGGRRPLHLTLVSYGWRHDAGMRWDVTWSGRRPGGVVAEWWLEARREGVVLHHLVHEAPSDARALGRYRSAVMQAMQAMKDHLELAVAHAAGRVP